MSKDPTYSVYHTGIRRGEKVITSQGLGIAQRNYRHPDDGFDCYDKSDFIGVDLGGAAGIKPFDVSEITKLRKQSTAELHCPHCQKSITLTINQEN